METPENRHKRHVESYPYSIHLRRPDGGVWCNRKRFRDVTDDPDEANCFNCMQAYRGMGAPKLKEELI